MVEHDPAVPIHNGKWEIMAQRMAMGDSAADAYRIAGYKAKTPANAAAKVLYQHPWVRKRVEYLKERMFDRQIETKLITRDEVLRGLIDTINVAKRLEKPQLGAVHSCYRTIAEMEGMLIRKSEIKRMKEDPFEDASRQQLVNMIQRAAEDLGLELDARLLDQFLDGGSKGSSEPPGGDAEQETGILPGLPEGSGLP